MNRILNFGSMNYDYVYRVERMVTGGETISSHGLEIYPGGKGLNQSIALARAGACVYHAGLTGEDGDSLKQLLNENGVNTDYLRCIDGKNGHAVIQVDTDGQNSIILFGGSNQKNSERLVDEVFSNFTCGDLLLVQNEVNGLPYMVEKAWEQGMAVALNPSPYNRIIEDCQLDKITYFILNEIEGQELTGQTDAKEIIAAIRKKYPHAKVVLTLGKDGCLYADETQELYQPAVRVQAVDTTAAGDTFTGYFLAGITAGVSVQTALEAAAKASAIAVMHHGASTSIPMKNQVTEIVESGPNT